MAPAEHLRFVEQIYAAALSPEDWPGVVESLTQALDADHTFLRHLAHGAGDEARAVTAGLDDDSVARFMASYPALGETRPRGLNTALYTAGQVISSAQVFSDAEVERSFVYNEIIRPAKGFYSLTTVSPDASSFTLSVCRSRAAGGFDTTQTAVLSALMPHVGIALELGHRLAIGHSQHAGWISLLERMMDGVILCNASGAPNFVNRSGLEILAQLDGLDLAAGGLSTSVPALSRRLSAAIQAVGEGDGQTRRLAISRPSGRLPLVLSILPAWRLTGQVGLPAAACVAVFIQEPDAPLQLQAGMIADMFRLTTREAQIAVEIAGGLSPAQISERLGLSVGTVRSHLKRVFSKTDVRSQAGLVALIRSCAGAWS